MPTPPNAPPPPPPAPRRRGVRVTARMQRDRAIVVAFLGLCVAAREAERDRRAIVTTGEVVS